MFDCMLFFSFFVFLVSCELSIFSMIKRGNGVILSNRISVHSPLPSVIHIGDADVPFVSSVKNLGVTLDSNLSMSQHISNTCKAAYIQIRHIRSI